VSNLSVGMEPHKQDEIGNNYTSTVNNVACNKEAEDLAISLNCILLGNNNETEDKND